MTKMIQKLKLMKRNGAFALKTMLSRTTLSRAWKVPGHFITE
jgi:hypothetical protein